MLLVFIFICCFKYTFAAATTTTTIGNHTEIHCDYFRIFEMTQYAVRYLLLIRFSLRMYVPKLVRKFMLIFLPRFYFCHRHRRLLSFFISPSSFSASFKLSLCKSETFNRLNKHYMGETRHADFKK